MVPSLRTGGRGRLPDFVIVGAMKAGTTSLWHYLRRHPQLFMTEPKEPQFFSRDHVYERGMDWYRRLFEDAAAGQRCGEASTCYSRYPTYPNAAARLSRAVPDAKLLYILRHPVDRLYSHYVHEMEWRFLRGNRSFPTFEAFAQEDEEARCASRYSLQIEHFLEYFSLDQLHVAILDDIKKRPGETLAGIQEFLEVPVIDLVHGVPAWVNSSTERARDHVPKRVARKTLGEIHRLPGVRGVLACLPSPLRRKARQGGTRLAALLPRARDSGRRFAALLSPLSADVRSVLCREYADQAGEIGELIGRPLPQWLE